MRFSTTVCLTFGSFALANPYPAQDMPSYLAERQEFHAGKRQLLPPPADKTGPFVNSVIGILGELVDQIEEAIPNINGTLNRILSSTTSIPGDSVSQLTSALNPVIQALQSGTRSLLSTAGPTAFNTIFLLSGLTNAQIATLATAIGQLDAVFDELDKVLQAVKRLSPEVQRGVGNVVLGLGAVVPGFLGPLVDFVGAAQTVAGFLGLDKGPLAGALKSLTDVLNGLVKSLGLGNILAGALGLLGGLLS